MKPKRTFLKNGVRVILVPMKDTQTVTTLVMTTSGSHNEEESEYGLAHFLEHMMFKGTPRRPNALAVVREIEGLGARTNAFTGRNFTGYYATGASKQARKLLDIISDLYRNPQFPEKEMEKEKGVVIEEFNMYEDSPQDLADLLYDGQMYGNLSPHGRPILGTKESVLSVTQDDLFAFHQKHYTADKTVVVVAGNFDEDKIRDDIKKQFGDLPEGPNKKVRNPKLTGESAFAKYKDSEQTHLVLGVPGLARQHKDQLLQGMMVGVLGSGMSSRLFHRLREEMGVCYYVHASANTYPHYGNITFHAGIPSDRLAEVVGALREELARMQNELVPEEELAITKNYASGSFVLGLESSRALAQYYGMQEVFGVPLTTPKEKIKQIRNVEAKDIKKLAKKLFVPKGMYLTVVGPVKSSEKLKKLLQ